MIRTILVVMLLSSSLYGGVVFDIEIDPPSLAPSTTTVTVFARKMAAADPDILMFGGNLAIDLGSDGFGLPAGFSLESIASPAFVTATLNTDVPQKLEDEGQNPNFDATVNLSNGSLNIDSTSNKVLFELEIGIAAGVPAATVAQLSFVENPVPGGFFSVTPKTVGGMTLQVRTVSGSVSVVPEPSSFCFMALLALAFFVRPADRAC